MALNYYGNGSNWRVKVLMNEIVLIKTQESTCIYTYHPSSQFDDIKYRVWGLINNGIVLIETQESTCIHTHVISGSSPLTVNIVWRLIT